MNEFKGIENLSSRKLKAKDYMSMADKILNKQFKPIQSPQEILSSDILVQRLFGEGPSIYVNATEFLMMGDFIKENDSFATVLSHGDFALDKLDYDTFFGFFCDIDSKYYFLPDVYERIKSVGKKELWFSFWDYLMKIREEEKFRVKRSKYYDIVSKMISDASSFDGLNTSFGSSKDGSRFSDMIFDKFLTVYDPSYKASKFFNSIQGYGGEKVKGSYLESQDTYLATREKLKTATVSYIKSDVNSLRNKLVSQKINKGFNSIYLSNIPEYLNSDVFFSTVNNQLMPLLKDDGVIVYCCQGVDPELLYKATETEVLQMRKDCLGMSSADFVTTFQEINDIESFQRLSKLYDVCTTVADCMCEDNGRSNTDVFVYVRK